MHRFPATILLVCLGVAGPVLAAPHTLSEIEWNEIDVSATLPSDLVSPEGKTRWDLAGVSTGPARVRTVVSAPDGAEFLERSSDSSRSTSRFVNEDDPGAARNWLAPEDDPGLIDAKPRVLFMSRDGRRLRIETRRVGMGWLMLPAGPREVVLHRALVMREIAGGRGWGPESLVHRWIDPRGGVVAEVRGPASPDGRSRLAVTSAGVASQILAGGSPLTITTDQIDLLQRDRMAYGYNRAPVCKVGGNPCENDTQCTQTCSVGGNACQNDADCVAGGGDQCDVCALRIADATAAGLVSVTDLETASSWDLSVNTLANAASEVASSNVPVTAAETCNYDNFLNAQDDCDLSANITGMNLGREDRNFDVSQLCEDASTVCMDGTDCAGIGGGTCQYRGVCEDLTTACIIPDPPTDPSPQCVGIGTGKCLNYREPNTILSVTERVDQPGIEHIFFRAGVVNDGDPGAFGAGESRICYGNGPADSRPEVPLWEFSHQDIMTGDFSIQVGDSWGNTGADAFICDQIFMNHVCPANCGFLCPIYASSCDSGDYAGTQTGEVVAEGPLTLPSGHVFSSLLVKTKQESCTYIFAGCGGTPVARVRTIVYLWQVPWIGTVARFMSIQNEPNELTFSTLAETDVKFGLLPPRSVTVDGSTDTSVEISWDPGLVTHRIDGAKVYWSTQSGADADYAFNSVDNSGQVAFGGNSAVISGLDMNTEYFFTVTLLSDFTNPTSGAMTVYESTIFPFSAPASPQAIPMEVSETTGGGACTPTLAVTDVTVDKAGAGQIEMCWEASTDPCLEGYQILGADTPESDTNFSVVVPDTGLSTCHTFAATETYFIVAVKGSGGTGPWGHYGR